MDKNQIGDGPVSFSYRARRVDQDRLVRLKVLRKRICALPEIAELHQRISRISAQYSGDNILKYTDSGAHENILFFEYNYFESISLRTLIDRDAPFHPDLVVLIAQEIIAALNQIHGVRPSPGMGNLIPLHRNLKPENIFISSEGYIKTCDLDMQQFSDYCDSARLELPYSLNVYQSPEQLLRGGYADRRSDIYSLGLVMFEMATGRLPYLGQDVFEMRQNIRGNQKLKLGDLYPTAKDPARKELTRQLARIIERMIEHDPDKRVQSLVDIESYLINYLKGANYAYPFRSIGDFLRVRAFQAERARKRGFIDRLFGG